MSPLRSPSLAAGLGAAALLSAPQAFAHAILVRSNPAANAIVPAPRTISLTFNEKLASAFSGLAMTTADGKSMKVRTGLSQDHKTITGLPAGPLGPGAYRVSWRAAGS